MEPFLLLITALSVFSVTNTEVKESSFKQNCQLGRTIVINNQEYGCLKIETRRFILTTPNK